MYNKTLHIKMAIFLAILGFATAQMKAQAIPIVQADTVFQGFGGGSVSGIVFGPTGETVILMHNAQPVEININTKQIVREFEKVPNYTLGESNFLYLKEKGWLINYARSTELNGITNFAGQVFWDITTGKIIMAKQIQIILSDGIKCFSFYTTNDRKYLGKYDINTFRMIDSLDLSNHFPGDGLASCSTIGIIPNSNRVLLGVDRYGMYKDENDDWQKMYYLCEIYLYDFDTKELKKIEIPYEVGQKSSNIRKISVSETGKYNIVSMKISAYDTYLYFFDKNFNFLFKETAAYFRNILNCNYFYYFDIDFTINDDYLLIPVIDRNKPLEGSVIYDITNKTGIKFLNHFPISAFNISTNKIVMVNENGITGLYDVNALPVKDNTSHINSVQTVNFKDSNLVVTTANSEKVDIEITDYRGNLLLTQRNVYLHNGLNYVKLSIPFSSGVYFCVIKTSAGSNSFKFMVSK